MPSTRLKFTKTAIKAIVPPKSGRYTYIDSGCPGLTLRVTPNGAATYSLVKKVGGRMVRHKIGSADELTVEQARTMAKSLVGDIAKGLDPVERKRAAKSEMTVGEMFALWIDHAKAHKRTWTEDQRQYDKFIKPWAARKASTIKRADVVTLHARVGERSGPYAGNRLLALVRAMFNHAIEAGWNHANPAARIKKFREQSRDRFLTFEEIAPFFRALEQESELIRDFMLVALLTGARRANVQSMCWGDLLLQQGLWHVPGEQSKNGQSMVVTLAPEVIEILERRQQARDNGCAWVFPSYGKSGHLVEPKAAWKRICERAGLADLRLHDLRRTLGSWQALQGASLPIIGASLGHRSQQATAVYARLTNEPVRLSVEKATASLMEAGKPTAPEGDPVADGE